MPLKPTPTPSQLSPTEKSIHNERVKLRATALNTASGSCLSLGVLAPLAASFFNLTSDKVPVHVIVLGVAFWIAVAYFLHQRAYSVLGGLEE